LPLIRKLTGNRPFVAPAGFGAAFANFAAAPEPPHKEKYTNQNNELALETLLKRISIIMVGIEKE
jgi:hypothetical protein